MTNTLTNTLKNIFKSKSPPKEKKPKKIFYLANYPKKGDIFGPINGSSPSQCAQKVFNKLCREKNFYNNENGTKYLQFSLYNENKSKTYDFIGTMTKLGSPVYRKLGNKVLEIKYRPIISRFSKEMQEVFLPKK